MNQAIIIITVTAIGLLFGLLIHLANARLPYKAKGTEKIETIHKALPGTDYTAIIHCGGRSEAIFSYYGVKTCRAAVRLLSGHKRCPYACLGFGDCIAVCPQKAITIDDDKDIAVIDYERCNGCGLCVDECAQDLIKLVPAAMQTDFRCNYGLVKNITGRERCQYAQDFISAGMSPTQRHN
jgi:Pyruvate/2-oxoacid:ferredoxin oxidoreductase delta subunit